MFSRLTLKDKELITSYIKEYACSCDCNLSEQMSELSTILQPWANEKAGWLGPMFGDKLILEREIEFTKPQSELRNEIYDALNYGKMEEFYRLFCRKAEEFFGWYSNPYCICTNLMSAKCLSTNIVSDNYWKDTLVFPSGHSIKVNDGAKTMRVLGKICKEFGLEKEFEAFRLQHSLMLNQKKLKGTLCLSIHPLDYMTMSDNCNEWSSCMSWMDDGDYRGGTVEMMNSPYVVVAYLKSNDKKLTWYTGEWNSKLWRSLFIVHPEVIISIKSYPYQHEGLTQTVAEWLKEIAPKTINYFNYQEIIPDGHTPTPEGNIYHFTFLSDRMYNDFGTVHHFGYISDKASERSVINYSGPGECVICGKITDNFADNNFVVCNNCCNGEESKYLECVCCGNYIHPDEIYWVGDEPVCPHCFHDEATECAFSGDYYFNDYLKTVYLSHIDDKPEEGDECIYIASYYIAEPHYESSRWLSTYCSCAPHEDEKTGLLYWNISDWTKAGLQSYWGLNNEDEIKKYISGSY